MSTAARITPFSNLTQSAQEQPEASGFDKRRRTLLEGELTSLGDDGEFLRLQANSLAVLATPDSVRTFRLATAVTDTAEVSDCFHLKPLLRAVAFPQSAFARRFRGRSIVNRLGQSLDRGPALEFDR